MFAGRSFKPGEVVCASAPLAVVPHRSSREYRCAYCLHKAGAALKRCAKCKLVKYCSRDCQRKDWSDHKCECRVPLLSSLDEAAASDLQLVARVLRRAAAPAADVHHQRFKGATVASVPGKQQPHVLIPTYADAERMVSHAKLAAMQQPGMTKGRQQLAQVLLHGAVHKTQKLLPADVRKGTSEDDIVHMLCR